MSVSERTWITAGLPSGAYEALTRELPASRLWSLLLEVVDARAAARRPASLMEQWDRDRFVGLAAVDQRAQLEVDRHLLDAASAFESIELSPVAPLGVCSSMGRASQNKVLSALRGTEVVAVTDGIVSYIGDQKLGGHCIWLTTENGASFYYAHLDRWAPGLYEGMEVQAGDLVGFVGNTGNAKYTPSHLHFGVNSSDEMVNPFPLLTGAVTVARAHQHVELGGGVGTR